MLKLCGQIARYWISAKDVKILDCAHLGTLSIYSVFGDFSTALILQSDIPCFFE